tara:strand:- start:1046 stop:1387 length:342 start_codon:yes stop_codon:yes gene_type:complete
MAFDADSLILNETLKDILGDHGEIPANEVEKIRVVFDENIISGELHYVQHDESGVLVKFSLIEPHPIMKIFFDCRIEAQVSLKFDEIILNGKLIQKFIDTTTTPYILGFLVSP